MNHHNPTTIVVAEYALIGRCRALKMKNFFQQGQKDK